MKSGQSKSGRAPPFEAFFPFKIRQIHLLSDFYSFYIFYAIFYTMSSNAGLDIKLSNI